MIHPSSSLPARRGITLLAIALLSLLAGCQTRDVSRRPGELTDFRVGQVHQLKVRAYILAHTGLVMTMEEARQRPPAEAEALLEPGTYFKVRQIISANDRAAGPRTEIYSEIVSGPNKGRVVNLRTASLEDGRGATRRNPAVLEPFFMGR
jgi:hypothetical protein